MTEHPAPGTVLDHIYASSGTDWAVTCLEQAPCFVRALRDVRESDAKVWRRSGGRWTSGWGTAEDVILPAGEITRLTARNTIQIGAGEVRYEFGTWQVAHMNRPEREILEVISGDEWYELLYEVGTWTLEDGVVVHMDRDHGIRRSA